MGQDNDDDQLKRIRGFVARAGFLIREAETSPSAGSQRYAYTIGLTGFGRPELLMTGEPPARMADLMAVMALHAVDPGNPPLAPGRFDLGEGDARISFAVTGQTDTNDYPLEYLADIYPSAAPPLQVVWPDENGRFPWETGYRMSRRQPLLGTVPGLGAAAFQPPPGFMPKLPQCRPPGRGPWKKPTGPSPAA
jgi:hypothetical protein